ncbi:hypothetical protein B0H15DRAFT_14181 [Mycena belliarum]|uniref:Secreted protein n=1 Tax=Mycena belliarum TaxID=1033014 RepID=A0AAD6Y026_9AGAR|nr:hypothetical protein B0H15DRAFT_14181 [Mycena belliae]
MYSHHNTPLPFLLFLLFALFRFFGGRGDRRRGGFRKFSLSHVKRSPAFRHPGKPSTREKHGRRGRLQPGARRDRRRIEESVIWNIGGPGKKGKACGCTSVGRGTTDATGVSSLFGSSASEGPEGSTCESINGVGVLAPETCSLFDVGRSVVG